MGTFQIICFVILASLWSFSEAENDEIEIADLTLIGGSHQYKKDSFVCPAIYGRYPHEKDCSMYYECRHGYAQLLKCNRGKLFDEKKEQCNDKRRVNCDRSGKDNNNRDHDHNHKELEKDEESKNFKCPYIWGTFAHPTDCSKYFVCAYNVPSLFQCYGSNLYDERNRKCQDRRRVNCGKRRDKDEQKTSKTPQVRTTSMRPRDKTTTTELPTTEIDHHRFRCPFPKGRFADPLDCSQFYECRSAVPVLRKCPRSNLYDERKEECLKDKYVRCGDRPGGIDGDDDKNEKKKKELRCPYQWGTFPHPDDCSKYLICIYNVPTVLSCDKHELFHAKYRRCVQKDQVTCDYRINPDDLSTRKPKPRSTTTYRTAKTPIATRRPISTSTPTTNLPSTKLITSPPTTTTQTTQTPESTIAITTPIQTSPEITTIPTTISVPTTPVVTVPDSTTTTPDTTTISVTSPTTNTPDITTIPTTSPATTTPDTTTISITSSTTTTPVITTIPPTSPITTTPDTTPTQIDTTTTPVTTTFKETPTDTTLSPSTAKVTTQPTTKAPKPNTPPPTECEEDDLDCIIDGTGDVRGWFDCPERYGHFAHGSSHQLFIHCDNWHPYVKQCADGTVFSPKYLVCMWLENSG